MTKKDIYVAINRGDMINKYEFDADNNIIVNESFNKFFNLTSTEEFLYMASLSNLLQNTDDIFKIFNNTMFEIDGIRVKSDITSVKSFVGDEFSALNSDKIDNGVLLSFMEFVNANSNILIKQEFPVVFELENTDFLNLKNIIVFNKDKTKFFIPDITVLFFYKVIKSID